MIVGLKPFDLCLIFSIFMESIFDTRYAKSKRCQYQIESSARLNVYDGLLPIDSSLGSLQKVK